MLLLSRQMKVQGLPVWGDQKEFPPEELQRRWGLQLRGESLDEKESLTSIYCFRLVGGVYNHQLSISWAFVFTLKRTSLEIGACH